MAPVAQEVVKTTTGGSINAGIWTLVGVIVTTLGAIVLSIIKQWGPWKKSESEARDADFERLRREIEAQNARIEKLEGLVETAREAATAASEHATRSDAKLQTALTACEVLLGLVEREMPQASEIGLVKRLLAQAASSDLGIGDGMRKIAMLKGVCE
jgi:outer membrane murein-binding lipoprotein Lpp